MLAARKGHVEATRLLASTGSNAQDHEGLTALHHAASKAQMEVFGELLEVPGIDTGVTDRRAGAQGSDNMCTPFSSPKRGLAQGCLQMTHCILDFPVACNWD